MTKRLLLISFLLLFSFLLGTKVWAQHPSEVCDTCSGWLTCPNGTDQYKVICCCGWVGCGPCEHGNVVDCYEWPDCGAASECSIPENCPNKSAQEACGASACNVAKKCINGVCIWECQGIPPCDEGPTPIPGVNPTCTGMSAPSCINAGGTFTVSALGVQNATSVKFPTWDTQDGQEDIVWYNGARSGSTWSVTINQSAHPKGNINVHVYMFNNDYTNVWCGGQNNIPLCPPKTCSLSLSSSSVNYPDSVRVDFSGNTYSAGSEPVRLWVERQDSGQITPAPGPDGPWGGKYYYKIGECTSSNFTPCSAFVDVSLPVGDYYFHCDDPIDPRKCSGNPFCPYEGCTSNCASCTGWVSCSNSDNSPFTVTPAVSTCTVTLSPASLPLKLGETVDLPVANVTVQDGDASDITNINFTSSNPTVASIQQSPVIPPDYSTRTKAEGEGTATITTVVNLVTGGSCSCADCTSVTVTARDAWFQTEGGDVHAQTDIYDPIPDTVPATERYCSLLGDGGYPGVVSYGTQNGYDFSAESGKGEDRVSPEGWLARFLYQAPTSYGYDYFDSLIDVEPSTLDLSAGQPAEGIYKISGNQSITGNWSVGSTQSYVFLIDNGKLTINNNIGVAVGGFIAFIVDGAIEIDEGVTILEGIYIANGEIETSGQNEDNIQLSAEGMFVSWEKIPLNRKFVNESLNNTLPVETFTFRPDIWINAPKELLKSSYTWQELAP